MTRSSTGNRLAAVCVLLLASFMDLMDSTIVNVALPTIGSEVNASPAQLQWIVSGYLLAFAAVLVPAGRLGDVIGRRTLFVAGAAGFTLASLLAGLAGSGVELVLLRVIQGACAGLMIPQVLGSVQALFAPHERAGVYGIAGAVTGLAAVAGPLVGGALVTGDPFGLGWRSVFLINVPVGVVLITAALLIVPDTRSEHPLRLDLLGAVLATAAVLALVLPLVEGRQLGWPRWMFAVLALAPILVVTFVLVERRRNATGQAPLLPMHLFRHRGFSAGLATQLAFQASVIGYFLILTVALQIGFGFTPWQAGLVVLPFSIGAAVSSGAAAALIAKIGRVLVVTGAFLQAVGVAWTIAVINGADTGLTVGSFIAPLALAGIGLGLVIVPLTDTALAAVPVDDAGSASGALSTFQQVGAALGVAVTGSAFFGAAGTGTPNDLTTAFAVGAWTAVAAAVLASLAALFLPSHDIVQGHADHRRLAALSPHHE